MNGNAKKAPTWDELKPQIDIATLAAHLLGPAASKRGSRGKWLCPFHPDHDPSLEVDARYQNFRCWACGQRGDAMALLMGIRGLTFREGLDWFRQHLGIALKTGPARAPVPRVERPSGPRGIPREDAERLILDAVGGLDGPEASEARDDLARRGITRRTAERFGIGFAPKIRYPTRDGQWAITQGLTIPWYANGRLARIKIRKTGLFRGTRYVQIFDDGARVYPDPAVIWPGVPLVITEGELDAIVVSQALMGLAQVVSLGGTGAKPDVAINRLIGRASAVFLALDADDAGRRAMDDWGIEFKRLTPPPGAGDWCDCQETGIPLGFDLTWWLMAQIGVTPGAFIGERQPEPPPREDDQADPAATPLPEPHWPGTPWEELARVRWGPGGDPRFEGPGFVVDRHPRPTVAFDPADDIDRQERAGIMEHDGGLSREGAERRAGLR